MLCGNLLMAAGAQAEDGGHEAAQDVHRRGDYASAVHPFAKKAKAVHEAGGYPDALHVLGPETRVKPKPRERWLHCDGMPGLGGWRGLGQLVQVLLLALMVILMALLLWQVLRRWSWSGRGRSGDAGGKETEAQTQVVAHQHEAGRELEDAEALWRAGHHEHAIRALLEHGLHHCGWRPQGAALAQTAREVWQQLPSRAAQHAPLGEMVTVAEAVRFAGVPVAEVHFRGMQQAWQRLRALPHCAAQSEP
ncbi:MAG: DUF4129 domain-containing protein [Polyangiales bacterium]